MGKVCVILCREWRNISVVPVFIFCNLVFFVNFVPDTLSYLIAMSINLVKFFVLIARACSGLYI